MSKEMIVRLNQDRVKIKGCEYVRDLIRCKDCKYYTERCFTDSSGETWKEYICDHYNITVPTPDDFCSFAELNVIERNDG